MSSFCSAKSTHIFSAKNIRILYIESAKTVNEMTLNELVEQLGPDIYVVNIMPKYLYICIRTYTNGRPRWLSWMRRLTGDQEVTGSTPAEVGNILS